MLVEDARGQPPTIPFWFGEAPARTRELSDEVSELRGEIDQRLAPRRADAIAAWLADECADAARAAQQLRRVPRGRARARSVRCRART